MYHAKQSATAGCMGKIKVWVSRLQDGEGERVEETTNTSRSFSPQYTLLSLGVNKQVDIPALRV